MDLGISLLTDDQLLELLQEACVELGNRDPVVRKIAQSVISTEAERTKLRREAVHGAVKEVRKRYVRQLKQEIQEQLEIEVRKGARVLTVIEEADIVAEFTAKWKEQKKAERIKQLQDEKRREMQSAILAGGMAELYSRKELQKMEDDATASAEVWVKQQGIVPLALFADVRKKIFDNLRRMGHSEEAIMLVYGKP